jgi:hypothetical protein
MSFMTIHLAIDQGFQRFLTNQSIPKKKAAARKTGPEQQAIHATPAADDVHPQIPKPDITIPAKSEVPARRTVQCWHHPSLRASLPQTGQGFHSSR